VRGRHAVRDHRDAGDLQLLAGQALRLVGGAARLQLGSGSFDLQVSVPLPRLPGRRWLNVGVR